MAAERPAVRVRFPESDEPQSLAITDNSFSYSNAFISFSGTSSNGTVSGVASAPGCRGDNAWSATPN